MSHTPDRVVVDVKKIGPISRTGAHALLDPEKKTTTPRDGVRKEDQRHSTRGSKERSTTASGARTYAVAGEELHEHLRKLPPLPRKRRTHGWPAVLDGKRGPGDRPSVTFGHGERVPRVDLVARADDDGGHSEGPQLGEVLEGPRAGHDFQGVRDGERVLVEREPLADDLLDGPPPGGGNGGEVVRAHEPIDATGAQRAGEYVAVAFRGCRSEGVAACGGAAGRHGGVEGRRHEPKRGHARGVRKG